MMIRSVNCILNVINYLKSQLNHKEKKVSFTYLYIEHSSYFMWKIAFLFQGNYLCRIK